MSVPHIVIVGGGFGGLATAQALRKAPVRITLIDRRNHHLFQPLLYQVATAALAPSDIAEPIRRVLSRQDNVQVRLATVTGVDLAGKQVVLEDGGTVGYDTLVLAAGATHSYFGHDEWAEHAPGLKTVGDALQIRQKLLCAFELAEWCEDPEERARLLTFVVVGAGPTGVELAGALREIAFQTLADDFKRIDASETRVVLVEGTDRVLGAFPEKLQDKAQAQLESLGVEVRLNAFVTGVDERGVDLDEDRIEAETVLWAAGVQASKLGDTLEVELDRAGRVKVNPDLSIPGHPAVMVIGDQAYLEQDGEPLPGVAPTAQQMGKHAAANVLADLNQEARTDFRYVDKGSMATVGRSRAVATMLGDRIQIGGVVAWLIWVFVHLMVLVGFRNRLVVFVKWAWAWFTFDRASRLIWQGERSDDEAGVGSPNEVKKTTGTTG